MKVKPMLFRSSQLVGWTATAKTGGTTQGPSSCIAVELSQRSWNLVPVNWNLNIKFCFSSFQVSWTGALKPWVLPADVVVLWFSPQGYYTFLFYSFFNGNVYIMKTKGPSTEPCGTCVIISGVWGRCSHEQPWTHQINLTQTRLKQFHKYQ